MLETLSRGYRPTFFSILNFWISVYLILILLIFLGSLPELLTAASHQITKVDEIFGQLCQLPTFTAPPPCEPLWPSIQRIDQYPSRTDWLYEPPQETWSNIAPPNLEYEYPYQSQTLPIYSGSLILPDFDSSLAGTTGSNWQQSLQHDYIPYVPPEQTNAITQQGYVMKFPYLSRPSTENLWGTPAQDVTSNSGWTWDGYRWIYTGDGASTAIIEQQPQTMCSPMAAPPTSMVDLTGSVQQLEPDDDDGEDVDININSNSNVQG